MGQYSATDENIFHASYPKLRIGHEAIESGAYPSTRGLNISLNTEGKKKHTGKSTFGVFICHCIRTVCVYSRGLNI